MAASRRQLAAESDGVAWRKRNIAGVIMKWPESWQSAAQLAKGVKESGVSYLAAAIGVAKWLVSVMLVLITYLSKYWRGGCLKTEDGARMLAAEGVSRLSSCCRSLCDVMRRLRRL